MKTNKVLSKRGDPNHFYVHPAVKKMLDKSKYKVLHKDWDRVFIIDGVEGSGKSLLGLQLGKYLDPTLNLDRVTFSGEEFGKAINKAEKGQCIIFDEGFNGLASSSATSKMNKFIIRKLMECRQKNLFVIIILPTIFLLQKYAGIFRSKALFHVFVSRRGDRGNYRVYNEKNKKILFLTGIKLYSYAKPHLNRTYNFRGKYPLDEKAYRKKKLNSLVYEPEEEKIDKYMVRFGIVVRLLKQKYNVPYTQLETILKDNKMELANTNIAKIVRRLPQN